MGQNMYSPYWYRVSKLKPRLNKHVQLFRHVYRGERWFLLRNSTSGSHHRFNVNAYQFIGRLDGIRTVHEIWEAVQVTLGDNAPTQDEVIELLGRLHARDLLFSDTAIDTQEFFQRTRKQQERWKQGLTNPLALRFPLVSPDRFLKKWSSLVYPLSTWPLFVVLCAVICSAGFLAALHWQELSHDLIDRVLTPGNLFLIWLIFPVVKLFHELAHAFAIRNYAGEVSEMGIMLLAFTPVPYVEASSSACFTDKWHRIAVSASGVLTELFLASLALFVWLNVEPGVVSSFCYNVMLIGGLSTLLFNGNPLLRFDGYYILSDFLEIPNLSQRSRQYLSYLFKRYVLRLTETRSRPTAQGEKAWFIVYGICSSLYKLLVVLGLILLVGSKFFILGVILALWACIALFVLPVFRYIHHLFAVTTGYGQRRRLLLTGVAPLCCLAAALLLIPVPLYTLAEGIIWVEENSQVRAGTDCFVREVMVPDESMVQAGDPVVHCEDPFLDAEIEELAAKVLELESFRHAEPLQNTVQRDIWKTKISAEHAELDHARERQAQLVIRSPGNGVFIVPEAQNLPGRFVKQGTMLGYIMGGSPPVARVVVPQETIALVLQKSRKVELRMVDDPGRIELSSISRETPAAGYQLPSPVLGTSGGGRIPVDPEDPEGMRSLEKVFQFDMRLSQEQEPVMLGKRVFVRFYLGREALIGQWYRSVRRLFLRRFSV